MLSSVIDGSQACHPRLRLPGLASAHSHAFQRALRSRTHRRSSPSESFWSWRGLMFALAAKLDPDSIFELSRYAFVELAQSGVTAVGEFHYVHHAPGGRPYAQRTVMAECVINAALAAGIRITLLRTVYLRAGFQQALAPGQDRFVDRDVDEALADTLTLHTRYAGHPRVRIGIAPHSILAAPTAQVTASSDFARSDCLHCPMHPTYVSDRQGDCPICGMRLVPIESQAEHEEAVEQTQQQGEERKPLYYRHPMQPNVTSPEPKKDEMGMDYVPVYPEEAKTEQPPDSFDRAAVSISSEKQQLIGVRTAPVARRTLGKLVRASGRGAYAPDLYNAIVEYLEALKSREKSKDSTCPGGRARADARIHSSTFQFR